MSLAKRKAQAYVNGRERGSRQLTESCAHWEGERWPWTDQCPWVLHPQEVKGHKQLARSRKQKEEKELMDSLLSWLPPSEYPSSPLPSFPPLPLDSQPFPCPRPHHSPSSHHHRSKVMFLHLAETLPEARWKQKLLILNTRTSGFKVPGFRDFECLKWWMGFTLQVHWVIPTASSRWVPESHHHLEYCF